MELQLQAEIAEAEAERQVTGAAEAKESCDLFQHWDELTPSKWRFESAKSSSTLLERILSILRAPNFQHISLSSPHVNHQKEIQSILQILKHLNYANCAHLLGRKNRSNNWRKLRIVSTMPCSNSLSNNKVWWHQPYHSPVCRSSAEIPLTTVTLCAPLSIR